MSLDIPNLASFKTEFGEWFILGEEWKQSGLMGAFVITNFGIPKFFRGIPVASSYYGSYSILLYSIK
jgi:hypothetical protein